MRKRGNISKYSKSALRASFRDFSIPSFGPGVFSKRATRKLQYGMLWSRWALYTRPWRRPQNHRLHHQTTILSIRQQPITISHCSNTVRHLLDYGRASRIKRHGRNERSSYQLSSSHASNRSPATTKLPSRRFSTD